MHLTERKKVRSAQAAAYLGISPSTIAKWRMRGAGPPFHRCGPRIVLYFIDDLEAWLQQSRCPCAES
jgi:predicted DNA-binding transcriptional regulator AlpA